MATLPLFRPEVIEHRSHRLEGDINLAIPILWQSIGFLLLATVIAAAIFVCTASYARVENVVGEIELDKGIAPIVASREGIVTALHVREGSMVHANEPLVEIRAEEHMSADTTVSQNILATMAAQDRSLAMQKQQMVNAANAERSRTTAQISGMRLELQSVDSQIAIQREFIKRAQRDMLQGRELVREGLISQRDLDQRVEVLLDKRQQLAALQAERVVKQTALVDTRLSIRQNEAQAASQLASLQSNRFELAQHQIDTEATRGYFLVAPIAGRISALTAHVGQFVTTQQAVMALVPIDGLQQASLYVPTRAAGFLALGQSVHLAIDAFPYERFGTLEGHITQISTTTVEKNSGVGQSEKVYLVTVHLKQKYMTAFGRKHYVHSGMTLSAHIITEKQTLLEWLFQPVYALRNR